MNHSTQSLTDLSLERRNALESRLLEKLAAKRKSASDVSLPANNALSFAQEGLWFLEQFKPNSALYNISQAFRLSGPIDAGALNRAFQAIVRRHTILRTTFSAVEGKPKQTVQQDLPFCLKHVDLRNTPDVEVEAKKLLQSEACRPFDLTADLLIRATLIRVSEGEHFVGIVLHHIVGDFSSLVILYREVSACYNAALVGKNVELPALPIQFSDWAGMQRGRLSGEVLQRQSNFWKEKLSGELATLDLPTDFPRPQQQSSKGAERNICLSKTLLDSVKELSRAEGTTLYLTLLTAYAVLLQRYCGQHELIIGSPIDQRNTSDAEKLIGYFINTLPLRLKFSSDCTFREALQQTRTVALEAFVNQEMPFEKLVEELHVERSADRNPIFQVVFQYLPTLPMLTLNGVEAKPVSVHTETAKFDLAFTIAETPQGLAGEIEYNTDLFRAETIERLGIHYQNLLDAATASPTKRISDLNILGVSERRQVLSDWNDTETKYPRQACVQELFEEQALRNPGTVALKFGDSTMTYSELNERANQLAHYLRDTGVKPDALVGLAMERSFDMIVGLLAILKAGGAYVPLDPAYPRERLDYMITDTGVSVLVTTSKFKDLGANLSKTICLDQEHELLRAQKTNNPVTTGTAENLAYVMYTSGSTGKPKGVMIPHRGIVRLVKETNYVRFSTNDVYLQFAPISFDASTFEIWGALLNGAKLVIYPPEMTSLEELGNFLLKEEITTLWLTAGLFHQMVDQHVDKLRGLKQLLAGGDVLSVPQVLKTLRELPQCQLINGYGPTENTTFTCCYDVPHHWNGSSLPIGKPISNTEVYILDGNLKPVPAGIAGELYIGGDGLAREYLNAPDLTSAKFVANPFGSKPGARMYKTGDRVRWTNGGIIEFLGRTDHQVKVRGFRIELGEVETTLAQHPDVKEATVLARQNCIGKELVGYVVPKGKQDMDLGSLRSFLQEKLPFYMVPAHLVAVEKFPLNANGKIDRSKLPSPGETSSKARMQVPPRNEAEQRMHAIWTEVLGQKQIGVEDNFFELGGHSLIATQIISRVGIAFGHDVPLRLLFESPTISTFTEAISRHRGENAQDNGLIRKRTRVNATRLDQLSDAQIETLFQSSQAQNS